MGKALPAVGIVCSIVTVPISLVVKREAGKFLSYPYVISFKYKYSQSPFVSLIPQPPRARDLALSGPFLFSTAKPPLRFLILLSSPFLRCILLKNLLKSNAGAQTHSLAAGCKVPVRRVAYIFSVIFNRHFSGDETVGDVEQDWMESTKKDDHLAAREKARRGKDSLMKL